MKAALRQEISDRLSELATDQAELLVGDLLSRGESRLSGPKRALPEDLLDFQQKLEDLFYRELNQWP